MPASTTTTSSNANTSSEPDTVDVRLLALKWQRRIPDTDPPRFKRWFQGDELTITKEEYDLLTTGQVKPTVQAVDDTSAPAGSSSTPDTSSTSAQGTPASPTTTTTTTTTSS